MNTHHSRHQLHTGLWATISLATLLALSGCTSLPPACPAPKDIKPEQLHGLWTVQLDGSGPQWTLQLGPHPEHQGSLRGELTQGALRYPVVADLEGGEFTLEESHDGQRIAATWLGKVASKSCGQALRGERIGPQERRQAFDMKR
jgi:hypothetical protein